MRIRETLLLRVLLLWSAALALSCAVLLRWLALRPLPQGSYVTTIWRGGELLRTVAPMSTEPSSAIAAGPGEETVSYRVTGVGNLPSTRVLLAFALVPREDGLRVTRAGQVLYVTPDELLVRNAYDSYLRVEWLNFSAGVDPEVVLAVLSEKFGVPASEVGSSATIERVRLVRVEPPAESSVTAQSLDKATAREGALAAAQYLARSVREDGHFRYLVEARSNRDLPGYDWPRHAGATYFLAQSNTVRRDAAASAAALRAAALLRDQALVPCGEEVCVASDNWAGLGSSALALLAFTEIVRADLDPGYRTQVASLAKFLRSQQRPDGEFKHLFDREARRAIDQQLPYYSGEAAFALARAARITGDPRDLQAARASVDYLTGPGWKFFGDRYYFGEEHWTCQAMADLWDRLPLVSALSFCLDWQAFGRRVQLHGEEGTLDVDGAFGIAPFLSPQLTPVASRAEAAIATLEVARKAPRSSHEVEELEMQVRRALALLLRHQLRPGPRYLFSDPQAVFGAFPENETNYLLRIDYPQHAGSALIRWIALAEPP